MVVIHPVCGEGEDFKLLGCTFDVKLNMQSNIDKLITTMRPKIKALLRTKGIYDTQSMLQQYKTHIWGYAEYHSGAVFHACNTVLSKLDHLQSHFLDEMHLTSQVAFLDYNMAPTILRRDIGILGFIHKRTLGQCHPGVEQLLPYRVGGGVNHNKHLDMRNEMIQYRRELYNRSLFALVAVYNMLPQFLVDATSIKSFQRSLTRYARRRCADNDPEWPLSYRSCDQVWETMRYMSEDDW